MNTSDLSKEFILSSAVPFRQQCGIYFLIRDNKIIYIGQSVNIPARIVNHTKKNYTHIFCLECDESELDILERKYLQKFHPELNGFREKKQTKEKIWVNVLLSHEETEMLDEMVAENGSTRAAFVRLLIEKQVT
jgi:predicted GIY-YIG superfamily endonuclease